MQGNQIVSALLVTHIINVRSPPSNALISLQKHEDESEAWLHRQVTTPHSPPSQPRPTAAVAFQVFTIAKQLLTFGPARDPHRHTGVARWWGTVGPSALLLRALEHSWGTTEPLEGGRKITALENILYLLTSQFSVR